MLKEFEWMGVSYAVLMAVLFVLGMVAENFFVMAFSLICAVCSGILLDGYPKFLGESSNA